MSSAGLPVKGYQSQTDDKIEMVNMHKQLEELVLCQMDALAVNSHIDQRWLAIARTQMEQAFMAMNRSVFRPQRAEIEDVFLEAADVVRSV